MEKSKKGKGRAFGLKYLFYDFVRVTSALPGLIAFRPKVIYTDESAKKALHGGAILASNHVGFTDPIYLMFGIWYRRHHFICIKDFFNTKFKSFLFTGFMCIPIDRENFSMNSFRTITDELKSGSIVTMFPEGHVKISENELDPFKSGMILMSVRSRTPIVPIYIHKRKSVWNRVVMTVGTPVNVSDEIKGMPSLSQIDEAAEKIYGQYGTLKDIK